MVARRKSNGGGLDSDVASRNLNNEWNRDDIGEDFRNEGVAESGDDESGTHFNFMDRKDQASIHNSMQKTTMNLDDNSLPSPGEMLNIGFDVKHRSQQKPQR